MSRETRVSIVALAAVIGIILALTVGTASAKDRVAPIDATNAVARRMAIMTPEVLQPVKIVKRETSLTTGQSVTTYSDGWVLTITPGETHVPVADTFLGYPLSPLSHDCIGDYDRSQNAIVARAQAYNLQMARINAMNRARSSGNRGSAPRTRLNLNYRLN